MKIENDLCRCTWKAPGHTGPCVVQWTGHALAVSSWSKGCLCPDGHQRLQEVLLSSAAQATAMQ